MTAILLNNITIFVFVLMTLSVNGEFWKPIANFFYSPIQYFIGYPQTWMLESVNEICSGLIQHGIITPTNATNLEKLSIRLITSCQNVTLPLIKIVNLLDNINFSKNRSLVIYVSGWKTDLDNDGIYAVGSAYLCRNDTNFVAVDTSNFSKNFYAISALNTKEIGEYLAKALSILVAKGFPLKQIHIIGHSLGAHIAGYAGRYFRNATGHTIPRITGLEPANPCFEDLTGLRVGDADFIDIIHTNPGSFGKKEPLGNVDFYVGGLYPLQKGCLHFTCSHARAYYYYAETVYPGNERNFLSTSCRSLVEVEYDNCTGKITPMGYNVPTDSEGVFRLTVNSDKPYGKNAASTSYLTTKCNLCQK